MLNQRRNMNRIGDVLQEKGLSLDDFLQANGVDRVSLLKEAFGLPAGASDDAVNDCVTTDFFAAVDLLRGRNQSKEADDVYRDITAVVEEVRRQRYERRKG